MKTKFTAFILAIFFAAAMTLTACSDNTEQPSEPPASDSSNSSTTPSNEDDADQSTDGDNADQPSESDDTGASVLESSDKLVVIEAAETGGSLEEAMAALSKAGKLTYDGSEGDYGFYLNSVNGYAPDAESSEYWAVYTTLGEYEGVPYSSTEYGTYDYSGKTCASASYGISGLPMVEGEIYVLVVETY